LLARLRPRNIPAQGVHVANPFLAYPPTGVGASARDHHEHRFWPGAGRWQAGTTAAFLAVGWNDSGKPANGLGDVALFCVAALSLPALFVAPIVACWPARVPVVLLRRLFALCLALIAARLLTML
jgi:uncharacterized membrane protein YfcA